MADSQIPRTAMTSAQRLSRSIHQTQGTYPDVATRTALVDFTHNPDGVFRTYLLATKTTRRDFNPDFPSFVAKQIVVFAQMRKEIGLARHVAARPSVLRGGNRRLITLGCW